MRDPGKSTPSTVRVSRLIGLLGVLFFGVWMVVFAAATVVMVAIIATGTDDLARTVLIAVMCAAFCVFNGWRLRRPLRRLRGIA